MTERPTIPILAERIEGVKDDVAKLDKKIEDKMGRVYVLLGTILTSVIGGIVVALVTR